MGHFKGRDNVAFHRCSLGLIMMINNDNDLNAWRKKGKNYLGWDMMLICTCFKA